VTQHSWYLRSWFLASVTAAVWAGAYLWYARLGAQPLSDLWMVPLRRRSARIAAAQEAVRNATDLPKS